jgi:hypothetical protein
METLRIGGLVIGDCLSDWRDGPPIADWAIFRKQPSLDQLHIRSRCETVSSASVKRSGLEPQLIEA